MTFHYLDRYFLGSLLEILHPHSRFEHRRLFVSRFSAAVPVAADWACGPLTEFTGIGYRLLQREPGVAYLALREDRIAIVRDNDGSDPERLVYVFPHCDVGHSCFMDQYRQLDGGSPTWERLSIGTNHRGVCSVVVRHVATRQVVEFVHRDEPIFPGIEW